MLLFVLSASSQSLNLAGHLNYSVTCAGVWHHVDSLNNEYALVGAEDRISIVDITNPGIPVEVYTVPCLPGQSNTWRELKTYNNYAYSVSEGGGGVIIINLNNLPGPITYTHWYGDSIINNALQTAHTIAATEGYLYIFGSNIGVGGCIIADITDPALPHFTGIYDEEYIHDGFIRNDTLWASEIYEGQFSIIDISNKGLPLLLNNQSTPGSYCHNIWLSENSQVAFTTDEHTGAPLAAFDVSDISNIQLKTIYFTDSVPNQPVHNVRVLNNFLINPSYGSQLTIVDAMRPDNLIEIARFSTYTGIQSYLCWDASPYLPSGNIIATDVTGGLYILTPDYKRACYLEGSITDSITGMALNNVLVEILTLTKTTYSNINGDYKTGSGVSGSFDIRFSKPGYLTKIYYGVQLNNGILTNINVELKPYNTIGTITSIQSGSGLSNAVISISNGVTSTTTMSDINGIFNINNIPSGTYNITATAWGYISSCSTIVINGSPVNLSLQNGYYDDFTTNNNWIVSGNCIDGAWERGIPVGTFYGQYLANPNNDVSSDCENFCFITGNGGGSFNQSDLDGGSTILSSPLFDLSNYSNPYINYSYWYFNNNNVPANFIDTIFVYLNDGNTTVLIDSVSMNFSLSSSWVDRSIRVYDHLVPTSTMSLIIYFEDKLSSGNTCEGGFDNFSVVDNITSVDDSEVSKIKVSPNPSAGIFNLNISEDLISGPAFLRITDVSGREVYVAFIENTNTTINLENLPSGLYFAQIAEIKMPVKPAKLIKK